MLKVWVPLIESIVKSVPVAPVTKNCVSAFNPFIEVIPDDPLPPLSTKITSPLAFTESALPLGEEVAVAEVI